MHSDEATNLTLLIRPRGLQITSYGGQSEIVIALLDFKKLLSVRTKPFCSCVKVGTRKSRRCLYKQRSLYIECLIISLLFGCNEYVCSDVCSNMYTLCRTLLT